MKFQVAAALMAASLVLCACSPQATDDPSASPSAPASTSSSVAVSVSPSAPDSPAALSVVAYWAAIDRAAADPSVRLDTLADVASDEALSQWQVMLNQNRGKGFRQIGASVVTVTEVRPKAGADGQWDVTACVDVSDVDVVDESGDSVVSADRPDRVEYEHVVARRDGSLYVTESKAVGEC